MRLKKAMYRTKQAERCWWKFFKGKMEGIGFKASKFELSLFICQKHKDFIVICLHVDDGFAMASLRLVLQELHREMAVEMVRKGGKDSRDQHGRSQW